MTDLDDLDAIARLDSESVLDAVERFADQVGQGWETGRVTADLPSSQGIDSVVVLGMGGSGVSGDVVRAIVEPRLPLPFRTIKSYGPVPAWVGRNTLVFAVSYSGSTEETVAAMQEARDRGARVVTVSSGGPLADAARRDALAHVAIPAGLQPRASLGFLTMPLLAVMAKMGLIPDPTPDVDEAVEILAGLAQRCHRRRPVGHNPAKDLARALLDKIPVVYGGDGVGATAAYRFKCDLNEYGKTPAFWNELPELDHNEIVGWQHLAELTRERFVILFLRHPGEHERVALRFDITRELIEGNVSDVVEINAEGHSPLAQVLSLVLITQLAAIYVGLSYGVDPGPVEVIQKLKAELKGR